MKGDPLITLVEALKRDGYDPRPTGPDAFESRCPGHGGETKRNLTLTRGDDNRALVHCHAHDCGLEAILAPIGLMPADLFPPRDGPPKATRKPSNGKTPARVYPTPEAAIAITVQRLGKPTASWTYVCQDGFETFRVYRFDPPGETKEFRPVHPVANGWALGDPAPTGLALYRLPELARAARIWIAEGEKCADLVRNLGLVASTTSHGNLSPHKSDLTPLSGKEVVILPDVGKAGEDYATKLLALLAGVEPRPTVRILRLPNLTDDGDDVEQWLETLSDLWEPEQCRAELERLADEVPAVDMTGELPGPKADPQSGSVVGFVGVPPQPRPISVTLARVPSLEPIMLPEPFRPWLADIAERACCPLDVPAISAIVSLATVVGRKIGIRPKKRDDWTVVPNLWGMAVLPPGWLKTHCLAEPMKPLSRLEMESRERHAQALGEFEITKRLAEVKSAAAEGELKAAAKKKSSKPSEEELRRLATEAVAKPDLKPPVLKRYLVNDATVEKLGELLAENPDGLLVFRDELMGFLRSLEKQGRESDRAFYLEAWDGAKSFVYDRIARGTVFIPSTTISVLGGIQPGRLAAYIRSTASGDNNDGLISRFQLAVYPDTDKPFVNVDRWPATDAKNLAFSIFRTLATIDPVSIGARVDDGDTGGIPYLRFAPEGQALFDEWRTDLEARVRSSQESDWITSHLAKYRSLMPSLALLFHLVNVVGGADSGPVSLDSASLAAAWCDYLEAHARRIYQAAFDGDPEPAQRLAERIKSSLPNPFTIRDVVRKGWATLSTTEEVERAVALLEEHDWLRQVEVPPGPQGGRPTVAIYINPLAYEGATP